MRSQKLRFLFQSSKGVFAEMDIQTALYQTFRAWAIKLLLILSGSLIVLTSLGGTAFAYNRYAAVSYADQWALGRNRYYPSFGSDCTNFASQALGAGGYGQVFGDGYTTNDNNWFFRKTSRGTEWSNSWSVAPDQYNFQEWHAPGGSLQKIVNSSDSTYWYHYDNINMLGGDELFYDWGKGEGISHVAFQVWAGYSQYTSTSNSWYGDLSDQHVTDRYHVSWSHLEVNGDWPTTTIYEMHIDDAN
jgi:hypothetical protein